MRKQRPKSSKLETQDLPVKQEPNISQLKRVLDQYSSIQNRMVSIDFGGFCLKFCYFESVHRWKYKDFCSETTEKTSAGGMLHQGNHQEKNVPYFPSLWQSLEKTMAASNHESQHIYNLLSLYIHELDLCVNVLYF